MTGGWQQALGALLAVGLLGASAAAADLPPFEPGPSAGPLPAPRFFPRGDGDALSDGPPRLRPRRLAACAPRIAPVPTNAPDDPSYVGSEYGLGKPSYYGFRPGLGYDDPFDRPLRYCP
ncbi:hypothetical protein [Methylorubrum thiocyanatum]|jgi:hypothetical protein|uniref:Uncharacterized protein n=1 Tax=Methylorubrum thiocyanatum TaxID=47958 RepID=A0AA40RYY7_9HYPH|nr:hypothetical protein [Methylorubrum thiocyanatum]MBA8911544.1 hypothetical protein [Methylorubrum thiocyanatum]GJE78780.1 hypothetical protein CJNNKLLH_0105 [Methylorubrum thiocyanatum]